MLFLVWPVPIIVLVYFYPYSPISTNLCDKLVINLVILVIQDRFNSTEGCVIDLQQPNNKKLFYILYTHFEKKRKNLHDCFTYNIVNNRLHNNNLHFYICIFMHLADTSCKVT